MGLNKDTALAKIKVLIDKYFEDIGRENVYDLEIERAELIGNIEFILEQTDINTKNIIIEKLNLDNDKEIISNRQKEDEGWD